MDEYNLINLTIDWDKLVKEYEKRSRHYRVAEKSSFYQVSPSGIPKIPASMQLRDYQKEAVINWFKNKGRGTLKMATGSGKTITALAITTELYEKIGLQVLLVVCPYRHLVIQWERECQKFNLKPILAFENVHNWQSKLSVELYNIQTQNKLFLTIITTNSTLINQGFQSQVKFFPDKTLIVGDEAHHLGSPRFEISLPRNIGLRLALSATPERYFDEEGTDALLNYFGDVIKPEFTLSDAIKKKALVSYLYYPIFVELTESEAFTYAKLTQRIGWALGKNDSMRNNENLTALLMQRSRLIGTAENKLTALRDLMQTRRETKHTLFYCGDGYLDNGTLNYQRQIEAVTRILGVELGYRVNTYTAETPLEEREKIRQQFERGDLQGLVAIRCLDEGVDIPEIQQAVILASTGNPHQFIQRRGRVLRPHPNKKQAIIYDMIVMPPNLDRQTWEVERNLLRKELKRFMEFAKTAQNSAEASQKLMVIQEQYQL
ncbi:DNA phosphorothioation system restriction enzyme [Crocosphaera sp. UHCC 0190]|uniref:DNA phosphorothioation system restriction enzyme n=1 Tax=Crocosphaera sp. UHCC 0190 TaxID=3110246 RepID=UPI002B1FA2E0|nr:DNA phosphorothioation system restriction enzyme [Crocosphaera sp. UHCC 0190]MEA5510347.1 DNA phosphorothioation system restriction enzyme [Crocosphaera sp. UHCC 0190]